MPHGKEEGVIYEMGRISGYLCLLHYDSRVLELVGLKLVKM